MEEQVRPRSKRKHVELGPARKRRLIYVTELNIRNEFDALVTIFLLDLAKLIQVLTWGYP